MVVYTHDEFMEMVEKKKIKVFSTPKGELKKEKKKDGSK